jgi:hypothetical protein
MSLETLKQNLTQDQDKLEPLWTSLQLEDKEDFFTDNHPDLQNRSPLQAIQDGDYKLVEGIIERMSNDSTGDSLS